MLVPTGPLTWLDDATGLPRIAVGAVSQLNYLTDGGVWAQITPVWVEDSPTQWSITRGNHRVMVRANGECSMSWKGPSARHVLGTKTNALLKVRKSDHQRNVLATANTPTAVVRGSCLWLRNIFPGIDKVFVYDHDSLTEKIIFHQSARDALATQTPWAGYAVGTATLLDVSALNLSWRTVAGALAIDSTGLETDDWIDAHADGTHVVGIKGGGVLSLDGVPTDVPVRRWIVKLGVDYYLVELFDAVNAGQLPEGVISHNATFGDTSIETSGQDIRNLISGTNFTISEDGTGSSISAYIDATAEEGANHTGKCAAYTGAIGGGTLALLTNGTTAEFTIVSGTAAWYSPAFSAAPSLTSGTQYTLVAWCNDLPFDVAIGLRFGTGASGTYKLTWAATYGSWPDPLSGYGLINSKQCSIYCTYTPAGAAGQPIMRRRGGIPGSINGPVAGRGW